MKPLVSILIPAFNAERWIAETIRSALNQSWVEKEIIVVDDGSSDRTREVAGRFECNQLTVITQPNRGACAARNHAFAASKGDFIQWLDADDLLAPDKIELQLGAWEQLGRDSEVVFSGEWGRFFHRPKSAKFVSSRLWTDLDPLQWLVDRMSYPCMMPTHGWLISRVLSERAGSWSEQLRRNQDGEYMSRVIVGSRLVKFVPGSRCYYRMGNTGSITNDLSPQACESVYRALLLCHEQVLSLEDSPRVREACVKQLQRFLDDPIVRVATLNRVCSERILELGGTPETVSCSRKYAFLKSMLGERWAESLKGAAWRMTRRTASSWERVLSLLPGGTRL